MKLAPAAARVVAIPLKKAAGLDATLVSIFCVSTSSSRSIHVWPEIVDVAPRFPMCVDQVVS